MYVVLIAVASWYSRLGLPSSAMSAVPNSKSGRPTGVPYVKYWMPWQPQARLIEICRCSSSRVAI